MYGRERDYKYFEEYGRDSREFGIPNQMSALLDLKDSIMGRILRISADVDKPPTKIWLYTGNKVPMMCVLFEGRWLHRPTEVIKIRKGDLRKKVLESDKDVHQLSKRYGISWQTVAAWKAVATRTFRGTGRVRSKHGKHRDNERMGQERESFGGRKSQK